MAGRVLILLLAAAALVSGCARTVSVKVPPRQDLSRQGTVGVLDFSSNADAAVNEFATREFQARIQSNQEGVRIIDLGKKEAALSAIGAKELDPEAFRRLGERYNVGSIFDGQLRFSDPQTQLRVTNLKQGKGNVGSYLQASIFGRLIEAKSGASVWSKSASARRQIANVDLEDRSNIDLAIEKGDNPRYAIVRDLVDSLTTDFRPTVVERKER